MTNTLQYITMEFKEAEDTFLNIISRLLTNNSHGFQGEITPNSFQTIGVKIAQTLSSNWDKLVFKNIIISFFNFARHDMMMLLTAQSLLN